MDDERQNLTQEELDELDNPVEEEPDLDIEPGGKDELELPADMPDGVIEDDSGFDEGGVVDAGDAVLDAPDGTPVRVGVPS
jgi:hypothetical protein